MILLHCSQLKCLTLKALLYACDTLTSNKRKIQSNEMKFITLIADGNRIDRKEKD